MTDFVHLHVHTEYSLLDGACRIKNGKESPLFDRLEALGQKACAITDHGVMYGVVDFYNAAKERGIKPIIGCEVYVASRTRLDRMYEYDADSRHLVLLCENDTGYRNLAFLVSAGFTEGFYIKPRVDYELLAAHSEGLIALSACLAGEIPKKILAEGYESARDEALKLDGIFGRGNFFLEIQDHGIAEQQIVNREIIRISEETGIPLVITNDAHYTAREDARMQDTLLCIQTARLLEDEDRMRFSGDGFYLKSGDEMAALFPNHPQAIENTLKIAARCQVDFEFGKYHLPVFETPEGMDAKACLEELTLEGFSKRFPKDETGEYRARLNYELSMINQMGFSDYFLIVADFIRFARSRGISVGPGRGSAAGSIVSYCLGITDVDPIKYALVFERFLNPERISMPDIDIDFCYMRRQEVIDYVVDKYGADKVAQIITFGTMAARQSIRDVGRVMNMPYADVDVVAKAVPFEPGMTLEKALTVSPDLKNMVEENPRVRELYDMAAALEGMPRHAGTHAAGVVITNKPVYEYVPLAKNDETIVTQYPMGTLEALGLLKMDFLGLRTLTVIADAERMIRRGTPEFEIEKIPEDDAETFRMLSQGRTSGVFQVESRGMTEVITGLRPSSLEDITAVIALYRPGPMQYIPKYIESRHHEEKMTYRHPMLADILSVTYGCMVYQEQVMEVFRKLAGYSLGKADMVRRAMSKKKMAELKKERENFLHGNEEEGITGCVANGVDEKTANIIFDEIMDFANYAFNKAHAVSYAVLSYRTAYLKCHYPGEFMAALLTSVLDWTSKVASYIASAREMGLTVLPPDINRSEADFVYVDGAIRFGLVAVKNIGRGFVERVLADRAENGPFTSFQNFCERTAGYDLNKRVIENLIKCGAFDTFSVKRSQLMSVCHTVVDSITGNARRNLEGQLDLFGGSEEAADEMALPDIPELSQKERLSMEKETTGLYLSGHPMDDYRELVLKAKAASVSELLAEEEEMAFPDGSIVTLAGILVSVKTKTTRSGNMMANLVLEDLTGQIRLLAFSSVLSKAGHTIRADAAVFVRGRISLKEDSEPEVICEDIFPIDQGGLFQIAGSGRSSNGRTAVNSAANSRERGNPENEAAAAAENKNSKLYIKIDHEKDERIPLVRALIQMFPGNSPVYMIYLADKKYVLELGHANLDNRLMDELCAAFHEENVKVV